MSREWIDGGRDRGRSKGKRIDGDRPMEGMNEWGGLRGGSRERGESNRVYMKMERGEQVKWERWMEGNWRGEIWGWMRLKRRGLDNYNSDEIFVTRVWLSQTFVIGLANDNREWIILYCI